VRHSSSSKNTTAGPGSGNGLLLAGPETAGRGRSPDRVVDGPAGAARVPRVEAIRIAAGRPTGRPRLQPRTGIVAGLIGRGAPVVELALVPVSLAAIGVMAAVALARLGYPFELEWLEGGTLEHVRRLLAGQPLYPEPNIDFVPFLYAPLYYVCGAAAVRVLGTGFAPLRLISLLATFGLLLVLYRMARRETGRASTALLAPGLFAALFRTGGGWFDLARVDMLFLLLLFASLDRLRSARARRARSWPACSAPWPVLTKQSALLVLLPVVAWAVASRRRAGAAYVLGLAVPLGAALLLLDHVSGGWFSYYAWRLPAGHPVVREHLWYFWTRDLFGPLAVATVFSGAILLAPPRGGEGRGLLAAAAAGLLLTSWSSRLHSGGAVNVLLRPTPGCRCSSPSAPMRCSVDRPTRPRACDNARAWRWPWAASSSSPCCSTIPAT